MNFEIFFRIPTENSIDEKFPNGWTKTKGEKGIIPEQVLDNTNLCNKTMYKGKIAEMKIGITRQNFERISPFLYLLFSKNLYNESLLIN